VFDSISVLPVYNIDRNVDKIRKKLMPRGILSLGILLIAFILTTCACFYNIDFCFVYIPVIIAAFMVMSNHRNILTKKINIFLERRHRVISEKLASWNELKFVECYEVQWSLGMLGSFIELACIEGRPVETTNFSFPPKIVKSSKFVESEALTTTSVTELDGTGW